MTSCLTCGAPTTATPALCDDGRAERARHRLVKAAVRWSVMRSRLENRRLAELEVRISTLEAGHAREGVVKVVRPITWHPSRNRTAPISDRTSTNRREPTCSSAPPPT